MKTLSAILKDHSGILPKELSATLNKGAAEKQLQHFEKVSRIKLPAFLIDTYQWKNGAIAGVGLIPEFDFLSLDSVLVELKTHAARLGEKFFPIFSNGAGDFICCDTQQRSVSKLLIMNRENSAKPTLVFDSLEAFFLASFEAWEKNLFRVVKSLDCSHGKTKYVDFNAFQNHKDWNEIFCRLNPKAAKCSGGIAILNTRFALKPLENPHPAIFSDEEFFGMLESTTLTTLHKHLGEANTLGVVKTIVTKSERERELQWFRQFVPLLLSTQKNLKDRGEKARADRLQRQIEFLSAVETSLKQLRI